MGRLGFIGRRLLKAAAVVLGIAIVNFILIRLAPGDPATVMAGEAGAADATFVAQLREEFGLDKPLPVQLFIYVKQVVSLDLGYSYRQKRSVAELVLTRLPNTLILTGTAYFFALA